MTSGGAPLPVPLIQAWQAVHAVPFKQGFGMTEFGPGLFSMGPGVRRVARRAPSAGPTTSSTRGWWTTTAARCRVGEVGELVLKGPLPCARATSQRRGHRARPSTRTAGSTPATWRAATRTASTSSSGARRTCSSPAERTSTRWSSSRRSTSTPPCSSAAVIGVPDANWGEVGRAYVVLKPGAHATLGGAARAPARPAWPASRCPSGWSWWSACRCPRRARFSSASCARRAIAADSG